MAASPQFKVYDPNGKYMAVFKFPHHAAMMLAGMDEPGWTIRYGHAQVVWTEGVDGMAAESYDTVDEVANIRASRLSA